MNVPVRILRLNAVIERTGLSRRLLYTLMNAGQFPRQVPLSKQTVGWPEHEVDAWVQARIADRDGRGL